ncbi:MAG: DinB family protein [Longimicrobiales bacterium]
MASSDHAQAIAAAMLGLWEGEHQATLRVLSAVLDDKRDYRPHPKSRSAWELATHIATADAWFLESIARGQFEFDREATAKLEAQWKSVADVVAFYEKAIPERLNRLRGMSGEQLAESVDFFGMMNMSRAVWIGYSNNHSVHHRGQLSAYLRAFGAKVPDIYGPSGDAEQQ